MLKKELILDSLGTAFAVNETKANVAARNHDYGHKQIALTGTEDSSKIASTLHALNAASSGWKTGRSWQQQLSHLS